MWRCTFVRAKQFVFGLCLTTFLTHAAAADPSFTWIEGESPASSSIPAHVEPTAHPEWLSNGQWLQFAIEPNDLDKTLPGDSLDLTYNAPIATPGKKEIWARIGFESARVPFDWRIDNAPWQHIDRQSFSTDLIELSFFCEVGWLRLGDADLTAGPHTLQIRIPKPKNARGQPQRLLFALDALCLSDTPFHPNSKFKPNEDPRTPADLAAAKNTFTLPPTPPAGSRASIPLNGTWEICRDDEEIPAEVAQPIPALPTNPVWSAIPVPSDKADSRPDLMLAHRVWYRAHINIPQDYAGRAFYVEFPCNNLNTTIFVNHTFCGFSPNPYARFSIDLTKAIKPGAVNDLYVGIKDAWYGYYRDPKNPIALRTNFWLPYRFLTSGFQDFVYPEWNHQASGILDTPTFVASGGPVYTSDVFIQPSVAQKQLTVQATLTNPSTASATVNILCEALDPQTNQVALTLPTATVSLAPGEQKTVTLSRPWPDPKLWWPDPNPALYTLRTTLTSANQPVDSLSTTFGFREWSWQGHDFKLNGIIWHGWADTFQAPDINAWLAFYRANNERYYRLWSSFFGLSNDAALNWFDRNGVVIRRQGILDGESMGYERTHLAELSANAAAQEEASIRGERNHPSIMIWSLENEFTYIDGYNLNCDDQWEKTTAAMWDKIHSDIDPTRPVMTDGGGAGKANLLPVAGDHYISGDPALYPQLAYDANPTGGGRKRWVWDQQRPRFIGEDFFFMGNHPELSALGGDVAFGGKAATLPACGLMWQILQQGYRWANFGAWDFWLDQNQSDNSQYRYYAPRVALVKQWDWTLPAAATIHRTVGLFNDSHSADPLTFTWTFTLNNQKIDSHTQEYNVPPGTHQQIDLALTTPSHIAPGLPGETTPIRQEGELTLSLSAAGQEIFHDTKSISVLNPQPPTPITTPILLFDPTGKIAPFLHSKNIPFTPLTDLKSLHPSSKVLIVGQDAIRHQDSTSTQFAAFASTGRVVIVLDQSNPLSYQALPADIEPSTTPGQVGFPEDLDHPALKNLKTKDFFTWESPTNTGADLFRNAYNKPKSGARSLIQCGPSLNFTTLIEVPTGQGLLLLSQLLIEEKLDNPTAQQLLLNLISYGQSYQQIIRNVAAATADSPQLSKTLDTISLHYTKAANPLAALAQPGTIAVISATPSNLATLANNLPAFTTFTQSGGWIIFNGLTPDGLPSFNKIVGVNHLLRPFKAERVTFAPIRDPLLTGLTTSDIAMYSSKRVLPFQDGNYVVPDEFSYVVDFDEVAPFASSSFFAFDNIVNGFVTSDGWPLIIDFPLADNHTPYNIPMTFPRPETFTEFTWIGNTFYWPTTKINLIFDGNPATTQSFTVEPNNQPQVLKIDPPRSASKVTLQIAGWQEAPHSQPLVGIDNIYLRVQRSPDFLAKVKPMLNVGGLVRYPQGKGGIILCNLLFKDREEVPLNAAKKANILAALLRNLNAPFAGGNTVIPGANLAYTPIDISHQANEFRNEKGWFDPAFTFADLPTGPQNFAGVDFNVYDFPTSPVPTVIMLGGPKKLPTEVRGIPVNLKADALFFLHTARLDRLAPPDGRNRKTELFHYTIHYADGSSATLPVYSQFNIANFKQREPQPLPGAQIAWTAPYEKTDYSAVAYAQQWNNPKPDQTITTIDLSIDDPRRGIPVLLAITAASAKSP